MYTYKVEYYTNEYGDLPDVHEDTTQRPSWEEAISAMYQYLAPKVDNIKIWPVNVSISNDAIPKPILINIYKDDIMGYISASGNPAFVEPFKPSIMTRLREALGNDSSDRSHDDDIKYMSKSEAFDTILKYEGIIGYSNRIKTWIEDIYGIILN